MSALPDGGDPFDLLGVLRDASEREIRRAYVRRIRQFRPESHPEEFARIRRAFELLTGEGGLSSPARAETSAGPLPPPGEATSEGHWAAVSEAWRVLAGGEVERAREVLRRTAEACPGWAPGVVHRFLLEDALGAPLAARIEVLGRGLAAGTPLAAAVFDLLDGREVRSLALRDEAAWGVLRRQPDRAAAIRLLRARHQALWGAGGEETVLAEVRSAKFAEDALDSAALAWLAREAMAVLAWDHPEEAEHLYAAYASAEDQGIELTLEDHYAIARSGSEAFLGWRESAGAPPLLERFLRVAPVLDPPETARLVSDLFSDFVRAPADWFGALSGLRRAAPEALTRYVQTLRSILDPGEEELTKEVRDRILRGLSEVDWRLHRPARSAVSVERLLAALIHESLSSPELLNRALSDSPGGFSQELRSKVAAASVEPALEAFYWTRRLGELPVTTRAAGPPR